MHTNVKLKSYAHMCNPILMFYTSKISKVGKLTWFTSLAILLNRYATLNWTCLTLLRLIWHRKRSNLSKAGIQASLQKLGDWRTKDAYLERCHEYFYLNHSGFSLLFYVTITSYATIAKDKRIVLLLCFTWAILFI